MNQREKMARMFAAIDAEGQRYVMLVLQGEYDRVQESHRPVLRLIDSGLDAARALAVPAQPTTVAEGARTTGTKSPDEAVLLASYHAMNDDSRSAIASLSRHMLKRFPRKQPALALVRIAQSAPPPARCEMPRIPRRREFISSENT